MAGAEIELYEPDQTDEHTTVIRDVHTALLKLAAHGTRTQIAEHLAERGHVGKPAGSTGCPVALYLVAVVPDAEGDISVGRDDWCLMTLGGRLFRGRLPEAVGAFVRRYDADEYPALVAPGGDE